MSAKCFPPARLIALGAVLLALSAPPARAVGGGTPDPSEVPVLQALRQQVDALEQRFLVLTASVETGDLQGLIQLADQFARIDAHFAVAAVGGGSPDPSQNTTLNQALLGLRSETVALRGHVANIQAAVAGTPVFEPIAKTLRFLQAAAVMLTARIDYALPSALVPSKP
jgi:hypothetical protein